MLHINRYPVWPDGTRKKQSGFGPFSWPLRENYEARYVIDPASLANDPEYGVPDFLWKRGDGNGCTVGPPGFAFTLTGAPTLDGVTPFQTPDDAALVGEKHTGASHRSTNAYHIDPADRVNHDQVVAISFIEPYAAGRPPSPALQVLFSTETLAGAGGWSIVLPSGSAPIYYMRGSHFGIGNFWFVNALSNCAVTLVALVPAFGAGPVSACEGYCGSVLYTQSANNAVGASGGVSLGSYVNGSAIVGAGCQVIWAATWSGLGIAANWKAGSNKLLKRLAIESTGMRETATAPRKLWSYATAVTAAAYRAAYYDRDGNLWPTLLGVPAAGDAGGLRHYSDRTNYVPNNFNPQATTAWTATGGAVLTFAADVAAITAAKLWRAGTNAFRVVNATGVDQYVWSSVAGVATDMPMVACCISVFARYDAGAGARLGWWDRSAATFTDVGAVSDNYTRTTLDNTIPPGADCRFCLKIPDGCELYFTLAQAEPGVVSSLPIPNISVSAAQRRPASLPLTEYTPIDANGAVVLEAAPIGYSGVAMGADNVIIDTPPLGGAIILHMESAAPGWATSDGVTQLSVGTPTSGVFDFLWSAWRTAGIVLNQYIQAGTAVVVGAYDGTKGVMGLLRSRASVADVAIKYIQARYP